MINDKSKIDKWLPHLVGLLLFLILPIFVFDSSNDRAIFWMYKYYYQLIFMILAFYVNYLVIVPRFFFHPKKHLFYIVVTAFAILLLITWQYLFEIIDFDSFRPELIMGMENKPPRKTLGFHPKLVDNFLLLMVVIGFSTGMANLQRLKQNKNEQKEIEKARLNTELAFLKNQISPHFFFNSLNNIYALIALDADMAQKAVEKLSGLMRYLIYDSDIKTVSLNKEFEFMQNYVDLMQQRLSAKVKLSVEIQKEVPQVEIPPLIFIPFVENAFKHGISYRNESFINITLITKGDFVFFKCENSIAKNVNKPDSSKSGLGIVNIKRRLDLIYSEKAKLIQTQNNDVYYIELQIPLN